MRNGVTLIELLLVLAIVSVLAFLSTGFYSRFLTQNAVSNSTDQLVQNLRKAQNYSVSSRKSNVSGWGVKVDNSTKKITLYQGSTFTGHTTTFDEEFTTNTSVTFSPASSDFNFSRFSGIPTYNGSAIPAATPQIITISGSGNTATVTVNSQGMITR